MASNRTFTLYFFSSKTCGHCITFVERGEYNSLKEALRSMSDIRLEHIEFEKTDINSSTNKPFEPKLKRYITHFPTFILVEDSTIKASNPNVSIFNMSIVNGKPLNNATYSLDAAGIVRWLKDLFGEDSGSRIVKKESSGKTCIQIASRPR